MKSSYTIKYLEISIKFQYFHKFCVIYYTYAIVF